MVFAELAFQRTVVQRYFDGRFQAYLVETFFAVTQNPGIVIQELVFQPFADGPVQPQQVGRGDTFAIRRIGDDDAFLGRLRKLVEILLGYFDLFAQSGSFDIPCGDVYGVAVNVVTIDLMCEFTFLRLVVVNPVKHLLVEVRPFLESIFLAEYARCDAAGDKCRFDGYRSRTAHRVYQVAFAVPARHQDHAGGQYLVQRGFHGFLPVAAPVQRFTGTV